LFLLIAVAALTRPDNCASTPCPATPSANCAKLLKRTCDERDQVPASCPLQSAPLVSRKPLVGTRDRNDLLAVTIFSLTAAVVAFGNATRNVTPRALRGNKISHYGWMTLATPNR
jgi:hypothetical protein